MDITKLTTTELKALAFDTIVQIEQFQKNLATLNQAIAQKLQEEQKVEETKKD
jgi:hypothetical protein